MNGGGRENKDEGEGEGGVEWSRTKMNGEWCDKLSRIMFSVVFGHVT